MQGNRTQVSDQIDVWKHQHEAVKVLATACLELCGSGRTRVLHGVGGELRSVFLCLPQTGDSSKQVLVTTS